MSEKTPAQKAHVRAGAKVALVDPITEVVRAVGLPSDVAFVDPHAAELVFVFLRQRSDLEAVLRPATESLTAGSTLWAFFRKGSSAAGLDMSRNDVWNVADAAGLRPLGLVSIDDAWTAFRLKRPLTPTPTDRT